MKINEWYYKVYLYNEKEKLETSLQAIRHKAKNLPMGPMLGKLAQAEVDILDKLKVIDDLRGITFYFFGIYHIFPEHIKELYSQFLDTYNKE